LDTSGGTGSTFSRVVASILSGSSRKHRYLRTRSSARMPLADNIGNPNSIVGTRLSRELGLLCLRQRTKDTFICGPHVRVLELLGRIASTVHLASYSTSRIRYCLRLGVYTRIPVANKAGYSECVNAPRPTQGSSYDSESSIYPCAFSRKAAEYCSAANCPRHKPRFCLTLRAQNSILP